LALANRIVEFGFISDAIQYKLSDEQLSFLPSGRLGFGGADPYQAAMSRFSALAGARAATQAAAKYPSHWQAKSSGSAQSTRVDAAYEAEFGLSASELATIVGELAQRASDSDHDVAVEDRAALIAALAHDTGTVESEVIRALDLLCLRRDPRF